MDISDSLAYFSLDAQWLKIIRYGVCDDVEGFSRDKNTANVYLIKGDFLFFENAKTVISLDFTKSFSSPLLDHGARFLNSASDLKELKNLPVLEFIDHSLLSSTWDSNFYHFIFDVLGKVAVHDYFGYDFKSIKYLFNIQFEFQRQFIELLELDTVSFDASSLIRMRSSYLPSYFCTHGAQPPLNLINFLRRELLCKTVFPCQIISSKIFLSRRDARNGRALLNEDQVFEKVFKPRGYVKVFPEDFSIRQQISLMSQARSIAGAHGAAFSLMIFMPDGASIFEIHSPYYFNPCFKHLAKNCGFIYASVNDAVNYFKSENWRDNFVIESTCFDNFGKI